ncbi:PEP/pyruvate-binding domain-containing protein [Solidesulfovibrio sp.]|uniref:PEP/pyruvate-binding domain-containing protein n=1 Tax=Solidesulfovibrio sp. TaxID=2910990 RepID=UPI002B21BFDB|nr:PEP/pyruvate-binding domain-containing protein [Solidesulfovibrio sp.]MEA5090399.1 PEP/pyruvate-binding domain-containing protein [Solidesulfovibrio sp.]
MAKTKAKDTPRQEDATSAKPAKQGDAAIDTATTLILTGADIVGIGEEAEILVGGKNYNTALISQIAGIRAPQFRAVSSVAFHRVLDETKVNASLIREVVNDGYRRVNWNDEEVNSDPEYMKNLVRDLAEEARGKFADASGTAIKLRTFINNVVEGFATSPEGIDQLRKRSVLVQVAILSVDMPAEVREAVSNAYNDICRDAGLEDVPVAVRSSAAGEDSRKKAFAGLQDTYLNIVGAAQAVKAYQWDCASAYNLRSMTYRREAILDAVAAAERTGDDSIAENAKIEWAIENTSLSVCIMRMINPVISGTAFAADTATGCRGTSRNDLVSIDASYGLGEAVVGGMVTPDKLFVFQRDDGPEVVIRNMGYKDKKIVYDDKEGGTKLVKVSDEEAYRWALSLAQAEEVARGVRAISVAYGGCIMDTEFCIDQSDRLWFVQARPETRWNEELERHPHTIFMRRMEVEKKAVATAEVILEGNGASRGAGQGMVRFLRSALELNKIQKGDVLAAERTDPDMVPGMRVASAILADAGGDTSHAAITSRELGIPAVIGIQRAETLRALDGQYVTVDGSRGCVYRGLLPLQEVGGEMDLSQLPATKTKVGLILADVGQALFLSRLRNVPDFEVGLLRAEFMLGNIGVHPQALEAYDNGTLPTLIEAKVKELDAKLTKIVREQLAAGFINVQIKLRGYVGLVTGLAGELDALADHAGARGTDEVMAVHRQIRELEKRLDHHLEEVTRRLDLLKTSADLATHVAIILGYWDELQEKAVDPDAIKRRYEIKARIEERAAAVAEDPMVKDTLSKIAAMRQEVARQVGIKGQIDDLQSLLGKIRKQLFSRGFRSGKELYVQTLSQGLGLFAMAFHGKAILYRTTDFKSNEYRNLLGGSLFEAVEDNPMLGYRGVSRNIHDWEIESFKLARGIFGGKNLHIMLPFVRTVEEATSMKRYLERVHKLHSGDDGLKMFIMSEIPSNAILAKQFIQEFDGFSIGSNDMTQMVLGTDRDNPALRHIYDEEDPAVVWALLVTIFAGQKYGKKVGFCGQGVSNSLILRGLVAIAGIVCASVVPDTYFRTKFDMAHVEAEDIPVSRLGEWLGQQHLERLKTVLRENKYEHIAKKYDTAADIKDWYDGELTRLAEQLRENLESPKAAFYRQEMETYRRLFHKSVLYATWDWPSTVYDAMRQAGFDSFKEQAEALAAQRLKKW